MKALPKSQILRFAEKVFHLARRAVPRHSSKFSKHRYTLPQHVVLLCLKVRKNTTYRRLLDELIEMPCIRRVLRLAELPTPSTLCKAFNRLDMAVWRILLTLSQRRYFRQAELLELMRQDSTAVTLQNTTPNKLNLRFSSSK